LATNLITSIRQNVFFAQAREFGSTLEAALFPDAIPVEVYHTLLATFQANLPTWHRYFRLRRKALGLARLEMYDLWAPLVDDPPKVSFDEAVKMICAGLAPLGEDYIQTMRSGCLEDRWVDVFGNVGKRAGACSTGSPGTHPFILMSYNDTLFSMSTLAHELGHSMHSYLTWNKQPILYSDYSLFVAEVASNFHQAMVRAHLFEQVEDRDFQITLIEEAMNNFHRYFLIMPTLARFELETHRRMERGEGLTAQDMNELLSGYFQEAYGGEVAFEPERDGILWATFQHLYRDYYVYAYATGLAGAHALAHRVREEGPERAQAYLAFLSAGASRHPLDALRLAGVDLTRPDAIQETFDVLGGMVDRLEALL
jgi:oligoendopeptidase F